MDYHILLAPLHAANNIVYLIAENNSGLSPSSNIIMKRPDEASSILESFGTISNSGTIDNGFERVRSLIDSNTSSGVFRPKSNLIVVLMSNGDDYVMKNGLPDDKASNERVEYYRNRYILLKNSLSSEQFRFITLVAHRMCDGVSVTGKYYRQMSTLFAGASDSHDICGNSFAKIFDEINQGLENIIEGHTYCYWPLTVKESGNGCPPVSDSTEITVKRSNSQTGSFDIIASSNYSIAGPDTFNTRCLPTLGEPYTGYVLQLTPSARVKYPECLEIKTSQSDYYGYVVLSSKPLEDSIVLKINGQTISKSNVNGWQYIGHKTDSHINIQSPSNKNAGCNPIKKSGYFIELFGSAIYSNSSKVEVTYAPTTI
jgi:hypothetical protein